MSESIYRLKYTLPADVDVPTKAHMSDAGIDIKAPEDFVLDAYGVLNIDTRLCVAIPYGCYGAVESKSGLWFKHRIRAFRGIIDSEYRGSIGVSLENLSPVPYEFKRGEKIAQLVIHPFLPCVLDRVKKLDTTERGTGGFGSSGK